MKKFLSIILALAMVFTFCGVFQPDTAIAEDDLPDAPVIEKPIQITVVDDLGSPVSGTTIKVTDEGGNEISTDTLETELFVTFLEKGTYTFEITDVPEGYLIKDGKKTITVTLTEGEEKDNITANSFQSTDPNHKIFCKHNPSHLETYKVYDNGSEDGITAYCFNQNYDPPTLEDDKCTYKRLVGSPSLLATLAQNERPELTDNELYDHVLSMIYHRDDVKEKFGLDDFLTDYVLNMALKHYVDGDIDSFKTTDENGQNMVVREWYPNGPIVYDENGNYQFRPGGTTLGSMVGHANGANSGNPDYVFPENVKKAWHYLVDECKDYPSDYFLYIYYPRNFVSKEYGIEHGWVVPSHYNNLYFADSYQCLMSTFTVEPIKAEMVLQKATGIEITKVWEGEGNEVTHRPSAEEFAGMIHLLANGEDVTSTYQNNISVTDNEDGTYTVSADNLPQLDEAKEEIEYSFKEDEMVWYTPDKTVAKDGETITNTYAPPKTNLPVVKTWVDNNDNAKKRPASITINLLADGEVVQTVEVKPLPDGQVGTDSTQQNSWTYTFYDLPVYNDDGSEIVYTITEENVPEYTTTIEGFKITNTYNTHPPTGDEMNLGLWIGIMLAAAAIAVFAAFRLRRSR